MELKNQISRFLSKNPKFLIFSDLDFRNQTGDSKKMSNLSGKPMYILKENTQRVKGKNALKMNIAAIKAVGEAIKTSLGPKGLHKMLIDNLGDVLITNSGSKILEDLQIQNPAAKMIVDLSKTIKKDVGDGTSSVVILIGALMERTEEMIAMKIPPNIIAKGFSLAVKESKRLLEELSISVDLKDEKLLKNCIISALNGKGLYEAKGKFADMIIEALANINQEKEGVFDVDIDNIQIIKKEGAGLTNSEIIKGIIVDKEVVHPIMPKLIHDAKIALIDGALEIVKTDFGSEIMISNPEEMDSYIEKEHSMIKEFIDAIHNAGANVVFCQKGVDELAQHYLSQYGIMAIRRVKHSDMKKLAKATGASIVTRIKTISKDNIGDAAKISEKKIGKDNMIFVENCKSPKAITMLIRGGTELIVDDAERALKNGLSVLRELYKLPKIVGGGGSIEIELKKHLSAYALTVKSKEHIAIEEFAKALEIIPTIIVNNSGKDPLDIITDIRSKVDYANNQIIGFDSYSNSVVNVLEKGIVDPVNIKKQIINLAAELAVIFIRVDDYISSSKQS
jgi:archaeal chaperonin